ncbi:rab-GTPase-TBC domain-containing protein [Cokeromyces recurvatus]|uniref:rab-GTPase-TBC domain-containing protein n=1 Tax=Cokeromyces recurvatus TaxID=90255 RepID=UPI002220707D|nr:rab-GTPase-TBC domain-containing protein [Cokeromyces recurvatus]KAI7901620.1 rab-GTPase-TBC domain-containing protein [Cokeromyces recurvatus]
MATVIESNMDSIATTQKPCLLLTSQKLEMQTRTTVLCPTTPSKSTDDIQMELEKPTSLNLAKRRKNTSLQIQKPFENKHSILQISDKLIMRNLERQQKLLLKKTKEEEDESKVTPIVNEEGWTELIQDISTLNARKEILKRQMTGGIPRTVRGLVWKGLVQISSHQTIDLYQDLLKGTSPYADTIERDTRQRNDLTVEIQESIIRVLKAYSVYQPHVGYYQGMSYLVAPLLMNLPENETFSLLVRLFEINNIQDKKSFQEFQTLFSKNMPHLEAYLNNLNIDTTMYAETWFLTLFMEQVPLPVAIRLYDIILLEGAKETVLRAALVLLQKAENYLMSQADPLSLLTTSGQLYTYVYSDDGGDDTFIQDLNKVLLEPSSSEEEEVEEEEEATWIIAQLRKENAILAEENKRMKMHEIMDYEAIQVKLAKRIAILEKRVKKYKVKLANATSTTNIHLSSPAPSHMIHKEKEEEEQGKEEKEKLVVGKSSRQYSKLVASLREAGEFGALIAGALAPNFNLEKQQQQKVIESSEEEEDDDEEEKITNKQRLDAALQNVTSELVAVKLDHFEIQQRYESLYRHCQDMTQQLQSLQESHTSLTQKIMYLESELEDVQTERDQIYADQEEVLATAMVAKRTAAELQLEKMALAKELEGLEGQMKVLQEEKENFFMPRGSFSEEVFAAHAILFGSPKRTDHRRHTMQLGKTPLIENGDEYKSKYVESELRCRELEKYLAEAKVRLAELECSSTPLCVRRSSVLNNNNKRNSTASLSMLANRVSTPTSPHERRESTESYASSTTSLTSSTYNSSKRSSMYSRIWNTFGSPATIVKNEIMCEEPQIIQQ